jgi:aryl-alcohol dehydrogenase-like predicted oxidoreductase
VALAWLIAQGAVPIPGAKNGDQARQNAGALGWQLTAQEQDLLTQASLYGTRTIQQRIWQHG